MPQRGELKDEEAEDRFFELRHTGFFVEYNSQPITLDTVPANGSEYIHLSRMMDAQIEFPSTQSKELEENLKRLALEESKEVKILANKVSEQKDKLIALFPSKVQLPKASEEKEWSLFCLGSKLSEKLFNTGHSSGAQEPGHLPLLSIVVHLTQQQVQMLLGWNFRWMKALGTNDGIGQWIFALLTALKIPVSESFQPHLETFQIMIKKMLAKCDESEKYELYFFLAILERRFSLNASTEEHDLLCKYFKASNAHMFETDSS